MLLDNRANGRVAEVLASAIRRDARLSMLTNAFSIYAYAAMRQPLSRVTELRLLLPDARIEKSTDRPPTVNGLTGSSADRSLRNKLDVARLARDCAHWLDQQAQIRSVNSKVVQNFFLVANEDGSSTAIHGSSPFTTSGLGIAVSEGFDINACYESPIEVASLLEWFNGIWNDSAVVRD